MTHLCLLAALPLLFAGYREATPGYVYQFPQDHFNHPEYRTEWWYYTGNLKDAQGKRFGFELVFFRVARHRGESPNRSAWRIDDLYLAHAALTGIDAKTFTYAERLNRAGAGLAGIDSARQRVWNGNWSSQWNGNRQKLTVVSDKFTFELTLDPRKPPVIHGIDGVSQKGDAPGEASHYVSFTRLGVSGTLRTGGEEAQVTGLAWMDHEWFTQQLGASETGWDWFSAQFDDRTELMLFDLRRKDGSLDPHSSGTFIDAAGKARHLTSKDFTLQPLDRWEKYPIHWRIQVPALHLSLDCVATLPNQELAVSKGGGAYWEGAVTYSGSHTGVGYLEMTGYKKPVSFEQP